MNDRPTTPMEIETRLMWLAAKVEEAYEALEVALGDYATAKGDYEIAVAKARLDIGARFAERGVRATVQDKEDEALQLKPVKVAYRALLAADAVQEAARANMRRLDMQTRITISMGTSVRTSMQLT